LIVAHAFDERLRATRYLGALAFRNSGSVRQRANDVLFVAEIVAIDSIGNRPGGSFGTHTFIS
jgi:hypothetical protein